MQRFLKKMSRALGHIWSFLTIGWRFVYSELDDLYEFETLGGIWTYSLNMMAVVVFGTCLEAMGLFAVISCLVIICAFWYVVLPLVLVFLFIVFMRWIHLTNINSSWRKGNGR